MARSGGESETGADPASPDRALPSANPIARNVAVTIRHIAKTDKLPLRGCYIEAALSMYVNFEGAYRMALSLTAFMAGPLDQVTADSLMERAKGICPYADATKTNMSLNLKAVLNTPEAA